jgi:very-short-patch-repair endonuclease
LICRGRRLVIELDGGQHADNSRDATRDNWLVDHNYRVQRFWNNDVLGNMAGVLETIASALAEAPPHPDR